MPICTTWYLMSKRNIFVEFHVNSFRPSRWEFCRTLIFWREEGESHHVHRGGDNRTVRRVALLVYLSSCWLVKLAEDYHGFLLATDGKPGWIPAGYVRLIKINRSPARSNNRDCYRISRSSRLRMYTLFGTRVSHCFFIQYLSHEKNQARREIDGGTMKLGFVRFTAVNLIGGNCIDPPPPPLSRLVYPSKSIYF